MPELVTIWNFPLIPIAGNPITVGELVLVLVLVLVGYGLSRFFEHVLHRRLSKTEMRPDAVQTLQRILFYVLIVCVVLTALSLLHIPITAFAFLTGAVAIGVGFGAQNIINNFISCWILMTERPVRIDDFIEVDNHAGIVERIGNRSTRIRRVDGVHILVPNSQMLERTVVNWTLVDNHIRTTITVGVAYGSPTARVAELFLQAVQAEPNVLTDPPPRIIFSDYGDSALIFDAYFWSDVPGGSSGGEGPLRVVRSNIRHRIAELFAQEGIVIAFPQQDVHIDSTRPLQFEIVGDNTAAKTRSED
ncbi:MAG: mechanosensitive ion channel [Woeseiaceae bacterium]|nr:mechanosensitive ion channel [Woeseiaceae bacterium]